MRPECDVKFKRLVYRDSVTYRHGIIPALLLAHQYHIVVGKKSRDRRIIIPCVIACLKILAEESLDIGHIQLCHAVRFIVFSCPLCGLLAEIIIGMSAKISQRRKTDHAQQHEGYQYRTGADVHTAFKFLVHKTFQPPGWFIYFVASSS